MISLSDITPDVESQLTKDEIHLLHYMIRNYGHIYNTLEDAVADTHHLARVVYGADHSLSCDVCGRDPGNHNHADEMIVSAADLPKGGYIYLGSKWYYYNAKSGNSIRIGMKYTSIIDNYKYRFIAW